MNDFVVKASESYKKSYKCVQESPPWSLAAHYGAMYFITILQAAFCKEKVSNVSFLYLKFVFVYFDKRILVRKMLVNVSEIDKRY